jgi:hypothetical protein
MKDANENRTTTNQQSVLRTNNEAENQDSTSPKRNHQNLQQQQQEPQQSAIEAHDPSPKHNTSRSLPRPNSTLTEEERIHKQRLKKEMKRKRMEERLERRYRHAIVRKDPIVAKETKSTLESLQSQRMKTNLETNDIIINQNFFDSHEQSARKFIESMYHDLKQQEQQQQQQQQQLQESSTKASNRDIQTREAVSLLRHMTKGTQEKSMFANSQALWGYTRQKFQSRALLVYTSLTKVGTLCNGNPIMIPESISCPQQATLMIVKKMTWKSLTTSIQSIVSIGCGPGCDALGVLSFCREHADSHPRLQSILFMDYAMDEWHPNILRYLIPLWIPTWVDRIDCCSGDVTKSWKDETNASWRDMVTRINPDLYLISYLLTETRGQWEEFLRDLVSQIKPITTRLLFAEPTPWQLHRLIVMLPELDYLWLDSSHFLSAELQNMEGRLGPAVLMAWKRE